MLGGYTLAVRELMSGQPPQWSPALGLLPNIAIMPHFDRVAQFVGEKLFQAIVVSAPVDTTLVGIDEETTLACDTAGSWRVMGTQSVTFFEGDKQTIYQAGDAIPTFANR
jgi:cyanophycinase-like exopeptidase